MKACLGWLTVAIFVASCAATGVRITDSQVAALKKGETTRSDVITAFGQPTTQVRQADGTTTVLYTYAEARTRPETFIPIAGAFIGGVDSRSNHVSLRFDASDKLIDYTTAESATGTGLGAMAGSIERVPNQPRK